MKETFTYDSQNRLTEVRLGTTPTGASSYDSCGRLTTKTADGQAVFSNAVYSTTAKPHALDAATTAEGVFPATAQNVTYVGFDKVAMVKQGNDSICYAYGYDRQRTLMEERVGNTFRTKRYVGSCEYVTETSGNTSSSRWLTYLTGPTGVYAVVVTENNANTIHYVLKDNLGSWATITADDGTVEQRLSYDAWGNLRNPNTWSGSFTGTPMFDRGFTGHEHLSNFGLINMNGRMYDPVVSSFLSVDQYFQSPENAQGFNGYAYCMNNPLRYVDPSGWRPIGGIGGYTPNSSANAFDPYMFYGGRIPLEPRDLGLRELSTADPIVIWMEENSLHSGGNGAKGGWYRDTDGSIKYNANITPCSLKKTQSFLGPFFLVGDTYYSLFGEIFNMNTVSGQVVYKLETETWKNYVDYLITGNQFEEDINKGLRDYTETEPIEKCTNFNGIVDYKITALGFGDDKSNKYEFNYAGARVYFIVYKEPAAMITKVGGWDISEKSANGNRLGTSDEISGYNVNLNTYANDPIRNSSVNKCYVIRMVFPTSEARMNAYNQIITTYRFLMP